MKTRVRNALGFAVVLALGLDWTGADPASAQAPPPRPAAAPPASGGSDAGGGRIILDQPVKAAGLMLFPVVGEPNSYLYAPMTPRLARDAQGRPQFSFLRYVQNVEGSGSADAPEEGAGGGILHAVVTLDVSEAQIRRAEQSLERERSGAKIVGPAIYRSGSFALISAVQEDNGEVVKRVVGLGNAPVLEGGKASVSLQLTKLGAQILWQSFHMPTPDISFSFDMKLPGYWSPAKATIVANLDQVYDHEVIRAAVATPQFEFMLNRALDELVEKKAIEIVIIGGGGDTQFNKLVEQTHDVMRTLLFDKSTGIPDPLAEAGKGQGAPPGGSTAGASLLQKQADQIRTDNLGARQKAKKAETDRAEAERLQKEYEKANARVEEAEAKLREAERELADLKAKASQTTSRDAVAADPQKPAPPEPAAPTQQAKPQQPQAQPPQAKPQEAQQKPQQTEAQQAQSKPQQAQPQPQPAPQLQAQPQRQPQAQAVAGTPQASPPAPAGADPEIAAKEKQVKERETELGEARSGAKAAQSKADTARDTARQSEVDAAGTEERPALVGFTSYELKKVRREGRFEYKLDKYSNGELPVRFDENIGDLQQYLADPSFFREANLDDPLYKQREIEVYVDGMNGEDFARFVNFVSVQMRKTHQSGDVTLDEVRIDRRNFNAEGNRFRLLYGWKGDADRDRWLEYEWRAVWSFFGGQDVGEPWQRATASGIRARPPYQIRTVSLEADPENMKDVRSTTVRLYYDLAGKEQMQQLTLSTSRPGDFSKPIQFMLPAEEYEYAYEVSWRLRGNRSLSIPRARSSDTILYVDELPAAEP